jgi:hypothetical protein
MTPNFDEILLELSYRIPQGIVDLTNEQHLNELIIILEENRVYNSQAIASLKEKVVAPNQISKKALLNKTVKNTDTGRDIKVSTALAYKDNKEPGAQAAYLKALALTQKNGYSEKDFDIIPDDAPEEPNLWPDTDSKGTTSTPDNTISVSGAETRRNQASSSSDINSFKDAYISASKSSSPEKAEEELTKKLAEAHKAIDMAAVKSKGKPGYLRLETEEGSGKFIDIKVLDVKQSVMKLMLGKPLSKSDKSILSNTTKIVTNSDNGESKLYFSQKVAGRHPQQGYQSIKLAAKNIPMSDTLRKYALANGLNVGKSSEGAVGKKMINPTKAAAKINPKQPTKDVSVQKTKDGVNVGDDIVKYKKVPNEKELIKWYQKVNPKQSIEDSKKQAHTVVNQINAWNGKVDDIYDAASKSNGKLPLNNFGNVSTSDGRKKTRDAMVRGITTTFIEELQKYEKDFGKENLSKTPENKLILDTLGNIAKINSKTDLEKDVKARELYKNELDNLVIHMANSVDFRDAVADFTELKVGLQYLAEGKKVYFPSAENFQTADILILPDDSSWKDSGAKSYEEYLAENFQLLAVSLEVVGGISVKFLGGGGSANYNKILLSVYKNKETQKRLLDIQSMYRTTYGNQQKISKDEVSNDINKLNETFNWAVANGMIEQSDIARIRQIGLKQAESTKKIGKDAGNCGGEANQKLLQKAFENHHIMQQLTAVINNQDIEYTRYGNFNQKLGMKAGKVSRAEDDVADGVRVPCYMSPHHNPGFGKSVDKNGCISITPTNQNPSHIKSHQPDLIKNFKSED